MFTRPEGASAHISSQGFAVRTPPPPGGTLVAPEVLYPTTAFSEAPVNPRQGGDTSVPTTLLGGAAVPGGSPLVEGGITSPTGPPLALRASIRWRRSLTAGRHGEISTRPIKILTVASPNQTSPLRRRSLQRQQPIRVFRLVCHRPIVARRVPVANRRRATEVGGRVRGAELRRHGDQSGQWWRGMGRLQGSHWGPHG